MRTFLKATLFFLIAAAFARNSSAQCTADGPNLNATEKYIIDSASEVIGRPDAGGGVKFAVFSSRYDRYWVAFMNIDCSKIRAATTKDGVRAWLFCSNDMNCVTHESYDVRGEYWQPSAQSFSSLHVESGDQLATENLARALQHYVFLLQAQYRQTHNNSSDPFAPK